ncbi:hypothetical protein ABLU83_21685 [Klebsiella sp. CN_Kp098]|uniref:hypothetical protein n=1 Tax=unclassified Klebsiella TaxID=2608929 RepID=UPI0032B5C437
MTARQRRHPALTLSTERPRARELAGKAAWLERSISRLPCGPAATDDVIHLLRQAAEWWQAARDAARPGSANRQWYDARAEYCLNPATQSRLQGRRLTTVADPAASGK